ncbi:MAG: tetratricopeptide repeat protein, partial [Bacteroidota bacterium]
MSKISFLLALFIGLLTTALSQTTELKGQLILHNGKYKKGSDQYFDKVKVSNTNGQSTRTNSTGHFQFSIQAAKVETPLDIDIFKSGYEVVNSEILQEILPKDAEFLRIYLAPKGMTAEVQGRLLKISRQHLDLSYQELVASIKNSTQDPANWIFSQFGVRIKNKEEAIQVLESQRFALDSRLIRICKVLARENLDLNSPTYQQAFEAFSQGEFQDARSILANLDLDARGEVSVLQEAGTRSSSDSSVFEQSTRFWQKINGLELKSAAYQMDFLFNEASQIEQEKLSYLEAIETKPLLLALAQENLAQLYHSISVHDAAIIYQEKAIQNFRTILDKKDPQLAASYANMAVLQLENKDYDEAWDYQMRALDIYKSLGAKRKQVLADSYLTMATIHTARKDFRQAASFQKQALKLKESMNSSDFEALALSYENMAQIYLQLDREDSAAYFLDKGIKLRKKIGAEGGNMARSYRQLAAWEKEQGQLSRALAQQKQAIRSYKVLGEVYKPQLAEAQQELAMIFQESGEYDSALFYAEKADKINRGLNQINEPSQALNYHNLALIHNSMGRYGLAKNFQRKALNIQEKNPGVDPVHLAASYGNLAMIYQG